MITAITPLVAHQHVLIGHAQVLLTKLCIPTIVAERGVLCIVGCQNWSPHQGSALTPPGFGANPTRVRRTTPPGFGAIVSVNGPIFAQVAEKTSRSDW